MTSSQITAPESTTRTGRAAASGSPARQSSAPRERSRSDIQGLRAVAVLAVLLFHVWPRRLTGGYVGVDVFFVISGFLITSHLLRSPVTNGSELLTFWGRRVRRLIPAATVVLLVTLVASAMWLPATVLSQVAREAAAASLYAENWVLAASATDYLAADELHTPVQHYWSLSVEEQFYLLWPVVIGGLVWLATRLRRRGIVAVGIAVILAASLAWSISLTGANPARAYFVSTTRFWELAVGGLLAAVAVRAAGSIPAWVRVAAAWLGGALIAFAVLTYDAATAFPGWAAAIPTVGTALVIWAAADGLRGGPGRLLAAAPMRVLGDISYSLYLWHWPLIVIAPFALGRELAWPHKVGLLLVAVLLAGLSKRYVEDRFRKDGRLNARLARTFALLGLCMALALAGSAAMYLKAQADERADAAVAAAAREAATHCVGADAARDASCTFEGEALLTPATFAKTDKPEVYADECWSNVPFTDHVNCTYGVAGADIRVALVGNSHAGHWQPALTEVANEQGWELTTYLISQCYTVDIPLDLETQEMVDNCLAWSQWATGETGSGVYDLVVISNRTFHQLQGVAAGDRGDVAQAAYARVLDRLTANGTPVLVLRDTPAAAQNVPDCLAAHPEDWAACTTPADIALERDPLAQAGEEDASGLVSVADINNLICREGTCLPVVGGVIVYFDHGHLSRTFAETLSPEIEQAMTEALAAGQ